MNERIAVLGRDMETAVRELADAVHLVGVAKKVMREAPPRGRIGDVAMLRKIVDALYLAGVAREARPRGRIGDEQIAALEREITEVERDIAELKKEVVTLKEPIAALVALLQLHALVKRHALMKLWKEQIPARRAAAL